MNTRRKRAFRIPPSRNCSLGQSVPRSLWGWSWSLKLKPLGSFAWLIALENDSHALKNGKHWPLLWSIAINLDSLATISVSMKAFSFNHETFHHQSLLASGRTQKFSESAIALEIGHRVSFQGHSNFILPMLFGSQLIQEIFMQF